jgi:predicted SprT family Zn-dependent metalloprotease
MPEEMLLARRLELLGLPRPAGLRVTDNRTVMVSLSPKGVVSVHRGYARAPDRVLRAVVRFLSPGTPRRLRRAAERVILSFRAEDHAAGPPARRRAADRPQTGDLEKVERLTQLFRLLNERHFEGLLPELPFRISGRMRTRLGQLCLRHGTGEPYEITMNRGHIGRHGWDEAAHTLLHEMVHLWQHANGHPVDHGPNFRAMAERVGVAAAARRTVRTRNSPARAARIG